MALSKCNCLLLVLVASVLIGVLGILIEYSTMENNASNPTPNMNPAEVIAKNKVKNALTGEYVTMDSFWETQPAVITFFRRWGCVFCRVAARELSSVKKDLDAHNVRLIGIGVEDLGKEDFINGNFFDGELYIDEEKKCYKDLNYKRYGRLSILPALLTKTSLDAFFAGRSQNLGGDMRGDYYQVGGTLVVSAGGEKVLLNHKQETLADHMSAIEVLKSLGIEPENAIKSENKLEDAQCNADTKESECQR